MEIRSLRADDLEQAWELDRYAFRSAPEKRGSYLHWDPVRITGAFENGRLLATVGALAFGAASVYTGRRLRRFPRRRFARRRRRRIPPTAAARRRCRRRRFETPGRRRSRHSANRL